MRVVANAAIISGKSNACVFNARVRVHSAVDSSIIARAFEVVHKSCVLRDYARSLSDLAVSNKWYLAI